MRISPLVSNPEEALANAQSAVMESLGIDPLASSGCGTGCGCDSCSTTMAEGEACDTSMEMSHEDGCECGSCSSMAKMTPDNDVLSSSGLSLSNPLQSLHWGSKLDLTNKVLNVHFLPASSPSYMNVPTEDWNAYEIQQAKIALETFSDALDITIAYTDNKNEAEFVLHLLSGASSNQFMGGALGMMSPPDEIHEGYGWFNRDGYGWDTSAGGGLEQGGYGFITLIHEFGHGFGLAHPHDDGGTSGVLPGVSHNQDPGNHKLNQGVFTTMTYYDGWPTEKGQSPNAAFGWQSTPMSLDLAILQQMYGTGTHNEGPTSFVLPSGSSVGVDFKAIWDSSGADEIVNNTGQTSTIDLREAPILQAENGAGYVSHIGTVFGGFTIPANVEIENVTGGNAADAIYGNDLDNVIDASGGNDDIHHGGGSNTYSGGTGNDHIYFPSALGTYNVSAPGSVLTITDSSGSSTIDPSIEYFVFDGTTYSYDTVIGSALPNRDPEFTSVAAVNFQETSSGAAYTATATDADLDTLTYTIVGGADQAAFTINSSTGEVQFNSPPSFSGMGSADGDNDYHIDLSVSDGNDGTATLSVVITVTEAAATEVVYDGVTYELIIDNLRSFDDAEAHAASLGGYLAVLTDAGEAAAVYGMVEDWFESNTNAYSESYAEDGGLAAYVWAGAGDHLSEGSWTWSNGQSLDDTFTNWGQGHGGHPGEPDNYGGVQDALGIALEAWPYQNPPYIGSTGEWNDLDPSNMLYAIVEYGDDQTLETDGDVDLLSIPWEGYEVQPEGGGTAVSLRSSSGTLISKATNLIHGEDDGGSGYIALELYEGRRGVDSYRVQQFDSSGYATGKVELGGSTTQLIDWEDDFEVDLNGDLTVGHTYTEIESDGDVTLSSSTTGGYSINDGGGEIGLTDSRGRTIPQSSKYDFEHAEENTDGGFDVLVNTPRRGVDNYAVRHFDASGEENGRSTKLGTSDSALVDWEDDFEVDLNGDLTVGHTYTEIESDGDVTLSSSTSGGYSVNDGGGEIGLTDSRGRTIPQSSKYDFEHAEENTDGGFDVLVNTPRRGVDNYAVRHFDASGEENGRATNLGTSESALVDWEDDFEIDLNGDLTVGHTYTEIESDGDVTLSSSTTGGYSVNDGGGEIGLTDSRGRTIPQSSRYDFEHAEENTDGGFDVLVNTPRRGVDNYAVRHFDASGEENGRATRIGTSDDALAAWEDVFEVDLNGDFVISSFVSSVPDADLI